MYKYYENLNFLTGASPAIHDTITDLGRLATRGYIDNFGSGDITFAFSFDGTNYGDEIRLKSGQVHQFGDSVNTGFESVMKIRKIRVTWVSDTAYKIFFS